MALSMRRSRGSSTGWSPFMFAGSIVLIVGLAGLGFGFFLRSGQQAKAYDYTITQSLSSAVNYQDNNYFEVNPVKNTVYISELVKDIDISLNYQYRANESANLTYTTSATAMLSAQYASSSDADDTADAWSKSYVLSPAKTTTENSANIQASPSVTVPFGEYQAEVAKLTEGLNIALDGQAVITFTVRVTGEANGQAINDVRTSMVTIPLGEPAFSLETQVEKQANASVAAPAPVNNWLSCNRVLTVSTVIILIGGVLMVLGVRRQGNASSYERELAKIMRYHEGVIVRATEPGDIAGKQLVPLRSFDDMLNLEEELRTPIVAVPAGAEATQFMIIHESVVYRFVLGRLPTHTDTDSGVGHSPTTRHTKRKP